MSMFDWFRSEVPDLFNPTCKACGKPVHGLQTKDLHCQQDTYVLRSDGSVLRCFFHDPDEGEDDPELTPPKLFHPMDGDLHVYTSCDECKTWNDWSLEFYAGKLVQAKRWER